jgi:hypothetical protein
MQFACISRTRPVIRRAISGVFCMLWYSSVRTYRSHSACDRVMAEIPRLLESMNVGRPRQRE